MRSFKFYKEIDGRWFVDLPEWDGSKDDLEMVSGADVMLDILAQGRNNIKCLLSTDEFNDYNMKLTFKNNSADGAWYDLKSDLFEFDVWLCGVTKFVFGDMPKVIYIA